MGILEMIIAFLGGAGGSWITRLLDMAQSWQDTRMVIKKLEVEFEHEVELAKLKQTGEMAERESVREVAAMEADERAMSASYQHDSNMRLSESAIAASPISALWAEIYKTITRPSLSHLVLIFLALIWFTADDVVTIRETITNGMLAAFAVIIGWWFGDRSKKVADVMFGPGFIKRARGVIPETTIALGGNRDKGREKPDRDDFPGLDDGGERIDQ